MAEAHQAVSYSELVKPEHTDLNHDKEVLELVWQSGLKSWKKRFGRFKRKIDNGIYPAHIESLWVIIGIVITLHFSSTKVPFNLIDIFIKYFPEYVEKLENFHQQILKEIIFLRSNVGLQAVACCLAGLFYWLLICLIMRYTLKMLLAYKGFMFEARGRSVSIKTKIWAILLKSKFTRLLKV